MGLGHAVSHDNIDFGLYKTLVYSGKVCLSRQGGSFGPKRGLSGRSLTIFEVSYHMSEVRMKHCRMTSGRFEGCRTLRARLERRHLGSIVL